MTATTTTTAVTTATSATCVRCGKPLPKRGLRRCTACLGKPLRPAWARRPYYHDEGDELDGSAG
jgi:hypothetical protein